MNRGNNTMENINGLTNEEVKIRINKGLVNYDTTAPSKSIKQITMLYII